MRILIAAIVGVLAAAAPASGHPVPFTYLDVRLEPGSAEVVLVAHIIDVAHDLGIEPPEQLLDSGYLTQHGRAVTGLLGGRMSFQLGEDSLRADGWSTPEALPERQSVRIRGHLRFDGVPPALVLDARLFPYDPEHQTFVNVYESGDLALQAILDRGKTRVEFFSGTRQGIVAVVRRFIPAGIEHILIGPDHLLFLVGLLLLGGTVRRLALVVSAFTLAHSVTLSLAAMNVLNPPARIIEPAIALSIVYVGADNLTVRGGRDVRAWIAFAFGFIHGFGFANVLREMDLPRLALGWSLFAFNLGVEIGQLLVVGVVASLLQLIRSRSERAGRSLVVVGSVGVIVAGAYWFVERVFFPG
ncbi:MAG: HupE/UreJ family protein [Vicinamibacterales bacterium]